MNRRIGLVVLTGTLAAGCGGASSGSKAASMPSPSPSVTVKATPKTLTVHPVLELKKGSADFPNFETTSTGCKGINAYSGYDRHMSITIYAAHGGVIGTGFARSAHVVQGRCRIVGTVRGLRKAAFYQVQWANGNKLAFAEHDLVTGSVATIAS